MTPDPIPTIEQVAHGLVALCRSGDFAAAQWAYYSPDIVSTEPADLPGRPRVVKGLAATQHKVAQWNAIATVHNSHISEPLISAHEFAITMAMDVTLTGFVRLSMKQLAVYEVRQGKIVREYFVYRIGL